MTTDAPARRPRRLWLPLVAVALPALAWLGILAMDRYEFLPEHTMTAMMAFQFLFLLAVLVVSVWFLFLSRFPLKVKAVGVAAVVIPIAVFVGVTRKVEFDGQFAPRFQFVWEPSAEELLAKHLASAGGPTGGADLTVGPTDSPRYRGLAGDGATPGVVLAKDWATPPKELWRHPVGAGHAGVAVAGNSAITIEQRDGNEVVVCYDRANGKERWSFAYEARFSHSEPMGGDGPRTTPAVADGYVFSLGARGDLVSLDGATGKPAWQVNVLADNGATNLEWGMSGSPVVHGHLIIVNPGVNPASNAGQAVAAYDRSTGKKVWAKGDKAAGYASPQVVTLSGVEQVLVFDAAGLGGHALADGAELWRHPWETGMGMNSAQPVVVGPDRVFISSEKSNGCSVVEVRRDGDKWSAKEVWKTRAMAARFSCPVFHGKHAYGLSDGRVTCVDLSNGKRVWADGDFGSGQLVLSGDVIVVTTERGKVVLVAADPAEYRELGRRDAISGRTWNVPALAGRQLFVRNHREMACLELPGSAR